MYLQAYNLVHEILEDKELNDFILEKTGKVLTVIDSEQQVTTPAAGIFFHSADTRQNTQSDIRYNVVFVLPIWGEDSMSLCHEFLDKVIKTFLWRRSETEKLTSVNFVKGVQPRAIEEDAENKWWNVVVLVTVSV